MTATERRTTAALAAVFAMRMLGLFVVLPVLAVQGQSLAGASTFLLGVAIGAYGLAQGLLQIPVGILSDRLGRKPVIYGALALFAIGGLVAAASDSIWGVIAGRAIQGCGAVSGVVLALVTDLTRDTHRPRAMAVIGATVGLSFAAALVVGPVIAAKAGLGGLFLFTSLMAAVSLLLVFLVVPTPAPVHSVATQPWRSSLLSVWRTHGLRRLNAGVFVLHLIMVVVFIVVPPRLVGDSGLAMAAHWQVYLPVVLVSLLMLVPALRHARRQDGARRALVGAALAMALSLIVLAVPGTGLAGIVGGLLLYFAAFNVLEALMPTLVGQWCPPGARGAAMGVYSSGQFLGAFCGGLVGGALASWLTGSQVLVLAAILLLGWLPMLIGLREASRRREFSLALPPGMDSGGARHFAAGLLAVDGVLSATAVPENGLVSVVVDDARCDQTMLHVALSRATWAPR